jgi:hypothetical protein
MNRDVIVAYRKLVDAQKALNDAEENLGVYIEPLIEEFKRLKKEYAPVTNNYPILGGVESHHYSWEIDEKSVLCQWDETWQYGGSGKGGFSFPIRFIFNPRLFEEWKEELRAKYAEWQEHVKQAELANKRRLFEKLKEELGEK